MHLRIPLTTAILASLAAASPYLQERQNTLPTLSLVANGTGLAPAASQLKGYTTLSFANDTAWIGQNKNSSYSEELLLSSVGSFGFNFQSYHTPIGLTQVMYILPNATSPVGFSIPYEELPSGAMTQGFFFDAYGKLTFNFVNNFVACQTTGAQSENVSWQLWWEGNGVTKAEGTCLRDFGLYRGANNPDCSQ